MKAIRSLMLVGALAFAGAGSAQLVLRPAPLQNGANQIAPDWLPEVNALKKRVSELDQKLSQANQQLSQLRAEYSTHTHGAAAGNLVYNNQGGIAGYKPNASVWTTTAPTQRPPAVEYKPDQ